jgi:amidohydrolase
MKARLFAGLGVTVLLLSPPLPAQGWPPQIGQQVAMLEAEIVGIRHHIHQYPELSNREEKTSRLVADYLRKLGLEVKTGVASYGVVAVLRGGRPGPVVAVRADMDALPVTEANNLSFKSTVRSQYLGQEVGVMHACGHDMHTAVQLGVASVLTALREQLPGTVKFIFQPAEEGVPAGEVGGAKAMVAAGILENPRPQAVFALHVGAWLPVGVIGYTEGPALAASDSFDLRIIGKSAHGSRPHLSVDPVVTAAQFILALQTIASRNVSALEPSVVTVGVIRGGERNNIIPGEVALSGTVRSYQPEVRDRIEQRFRELLKGITESAGATYDLRYERGYPAVINDASLIRESLPALRRAVGPDNVQSIPRVMGADDFSFFSNVVPGFYYRLGVAKPGTTSGDHHTATFLADDSAIRVGMNAMSYLLVDYLEGHK